MGKLRKATVVFFIKRNYNGITDICLAIKKRGFGKGKWNGFGGKVDEITGETVEDGAIREVEEESTIAIPASSLEKVAEIDFRFKDLPKDKDWNQEVHVFLVDTWSGVPRETEEMRPEWYPVLDIPYDSMWTDDIFWLPHVLDGNLIKARFLLSLDEKILKHDVRDVSDF